MLKAACDDQNVSPVGYLPFPRAIYIYMYRFVNVNIFKMKAKHVCIGRLQFHYVFIESLVKKKKKKNHHQESCPA